MPFKEYSIYNVVKSAEDFRLPHIPLLLIRSRSQRPAFMMNGINYAGRANDNSTGVEITTSPASSGSSRTPEMILICIMILKCPKSWYSSSRKVITTKTFKKLHEMPFPCGETLTAVRKDEHSCTPMDNTRVHDETMEKTETGEANGVAKYKLRKYFIMDTRDHDMFDGR
uniref:Uncharacterized protein LOC111111099 isoform X3 n=1 Tax=Crassostrea virginica TaxID=6565 RepID=A0A8B8BJQ8_CRAVI|nr:uncharacterized protein LOC111111099 isoform X3 [Crassostrea virginica]